MIQSKRLLEELSSSRVTHAGHCDKSIFFIAMARFIALSRFRHSVALDFAEWRDVYCAEYFASERSARELAPHCHSRHTEGGYRPSSLKYFTRRRIITRRRTTVFFIVPNCLLFFCFHFPKILSSVDEVFCIVSFWIPCKIIYLSFTIQIFVYTKSQWKLIAKFR